MLILTRRAGESIVVGEEGNVIFKVMDVRGNQVRIGVQAPPTVPVHRKEIYERIIEQGGDLLENHR